MKRIRTFDELAKLPVGTIVVLKVGAHRTQKKCNFFGVICDREKVTWRQYKSDFQICGTICPSEKDKNILSCNCLIKNGATQFSVSKERFDREKEPGASLGKHEYFAFAQEDIAEFLTLIFCKGKGVKSAPKKILKELLDVVTDLTNNKNR